MSDYLPLVDQFVSVKPGQALRLFPFGVLVKNGKRREITPEMAAKFKLPHFKAPIKLGSHDEATPAGGFLTGLEVREDGLYGLTEVTEKGAAALSDGDYRYQSPEVLWEDMAIDSNEGPISGPLIIGTALLHTPHLGEAAALFEAAPIKQGEHPMTEEMVNVPKTWFTGIMDAFKRPDPAPEPTPTPQPAATEPDKYTAILSERDEYKAKLEQLEAEGARKARVEKFESELAETKVAGLDGGAEMLAGMTDEQADWTLRQIRALSAQAAEDLTHDVGAEGAGDTADPTAQFNAAVLAEVEKSNISYPDAVTKVSLARPELYSAWKRR